ncbi:MAG: 2-phosphosulfolactate phosphatase [Actinomycetota bacterium]|nr:2-phosphosulfolactate phosphatase [Actinomycetota bacterium]
MTPDRAHTQASYRVRMEWGATGGAAAASPGGASVVVDVLSFTTTLDVAVGRGIDVLPYRWRDDGAPAYAAQHDAVLAVGRLEARSSAGVAVSLSPASLLAVDGIDRIVLPSPNGSSISFGLAGLGGTVVGGSLRNRRAVGSYVASQGGQVTVVAAGERWPDGSLRPAVEDLWGAGAVLAALVDLGVDDLSPEARAAEATFRAVQPGLHEAMCSCASGRELVTSGFAVDVAIAAQLDVSAVVPVLTGRRFTKVS